MKSNQFFFLTYLPLILIGSLVNPNSASASELAYGKIDISFNSGVYFQNNVVDFVNPVGQSNIFGDPANLGDGNGNPIPDFGTAFQARGGFEVTQATGALLAADFLGAKGAVLDQYVPPALLAITGGKAISNYKYVLQDFGIPSARYLDIDRDGNNLVDATYNYTTFLRQERVNPQGGYFIDISLEGFFDYVNDGGTAASFQRTYSSMSLLTFSSSTLGIDLDVVSTPADFSSSNPNFSNVNSSIAVGVSEPSSLGGVVLVSLLGWGIKTKTAQAKN